MSAKTETITKTFKRYELSFEQLQSYVENFKDCKYVYSHENNKNDDFSLQVSFDAFTTSKTTKKIMFYVSKLGKNKPDSMFMTLHNVIKITPVSKFSKSKSAYKQKESKVNTFFEDIWFVSKAAKNNSCQIVMPRTKRDC